MESSVKDIIRVIQDHKLRLAITRNISLFQLTCLTKGYTVEMTRQFGFSYKAIGISGDKNQFTDYLNVELLSEGMEDYLQENTSLSKIFNDLIIQFNEFKKETRKAQQLCSLDPYDALQAILNFAPSYFATLGFYNAYWRYLDTRKKTSPSETIDRVGSERNLFASLYPEIEEIIVHCAQKIGKEQGFEGSIITMMTMPEMAAFLKEKKLSSAFQQELERRSRHYFYLFIEKEEQEYITTNEESIRNILEHCFPEEEIKDVTLLEGQGASPGKVQGKVFVLGSSTKAPSEYVLVAHSTHPKDLHIIEKSMAIVAEEGGILSHAAILARELKKPAVVGTKIATKVFKDGDLVEVDANQGIVRKIKS